MDNRLTGVKCKCSGCGNYFNSTSAFDKHRIGRIGKVNVPRHCLSIEQMISAGMAQNKAGYWSSKAWDANRKL